MVLSSHVKKLQESATLKINARVNRMKQDGKKVFNLTAGEPDFAPPEAAKKAVIDAVNQNQSKYTPTPGIMELRELIAKKTNAQQPTIASKNPWKASDVVVTNGGKQAIFDVIFSLIDQGDEVIIPSPFWLSYPEQVKAASGTPVMIQSESKNGYLISAEMLERAITPRTKLLIMNSPSNPTGALYTKDELQSLGSVLKKHPNVFVLSDEIYDAIVFEKGTWCSFGEACPELRDRLITVNGLSKSGAMTGWRIGWSVTPEFLTPALVALQGHSTSGICSLSQAAAVASLKMAPESFEPQRKEYLNRRNLALEVLRKSAKIEVYEPKGAFYLFVDVKRVLKENQDANGFAEKLLEEKQVAVVSGVDFGAPTCIRLSFALDEKTLVEACQLIVQYVEEI